MNRTLRFGVLPLLAVLVASSFYFQSSDSPKSPPQVSIPQPTPPAASDHPGLLPSPEPGDGHGRMAGRSGAATESMPEMTLPQSVEAFNLWLTRYKAASPGDRPALEAEGRRLAEARLTVLADLVQTNPQRALQSALTYAQRKALPESIASKVETPINALADLAVLASLPSAEVSSRLPAVLRTVTIDGEAFQAFTYGDGNRWQTRHGMPVSGIAVANSAASVPFVTSLGRPGQVLALHETPARFVDAAEQADLVAARASTSAPDPLCGVSEQPVTASNTETTVQFGGQHHAFCGKVDAEGWVRARMAALGLDEPGGELLSLAVSESQYTEGRKRMLLMRPVWSDHRGGMTTNEALSHWQNFSNYMYEMSYGKLVMAPLGKGSSITPSLELPGLVAEYDNTGLGKLYDTCRAVARDVHGYQLDQYDFLYVVTDGKPAASYCGLAYVGGVGFHLANRCWDAAVSAHEFGHNLGLNHAHFWDTKAQSIAGEGQNVEYGDSNDPMGGGNSPNQFNSRYKNYLGWIPDTDILDLNLRGSGLYRLYSFDLNDSSGVRGLKFRRDASQNYWLQFRQRKLDKKALMNGVQLMWSGNGNEGTYLLDVRLKGNADNNAIAIGRTFSDPRVNVHFTPIGKAGTYPEAMDVVVNIGAFPTNQPPAGVVSASSLEVSPGQQVDFRAEASEPNGDALA
ncbi:MAG: hypothetical protein FJ405_13235, partial [Verrucomicrobia bacterium]|nr:hypothetical protein [Verrucomicrobiota bacterium]